MIDLSTFLTNKEWYDNSSLSVCLACLRKGFYSRILNGGLESTVGPGADFGTCIHGGTAVYYGLWGRAPESRRRALGLRTIAALHEKLFTGPARDSLDRKHTLESALTIFDHYCDTNLSTDLDFRPVEVELAGAVEIGPLTGEPSFKPFWYAFRIDGVHQRVSRGDYWIREMKTTGGGVDRELTKLVLARQGLGYLHCARQWPGVQFTGICSDVVGVMAKTLETKRDFNPKPLAATEQWRRETINIVREWRAREARVAAGESPLDVFYQNTGECTSYGLCTFYDLCRYGISNYTLAAFKPNTWNPLRLVDIKLPELEKNQVLEDHSIKESIKL